MNATEHKAVFLSYASQDAEAAKRICDALRQAGVEVWFDQSELVGGDAWDAKIRGQIGSCALFVPVISAATQARGEGYFRLEWKLAVDRSHLMAHDQPFLLPVVIDATVDAAARVPPEFRTVQWTKLPQGETPPAFVARVQKLLGGTVAGVATSATASAADPGPAPGSASPATSRPSLASKSRPWLIPAIIGGAVIVALALWSPWKKSALPAPSVAPAAAALTPAQQLVAKARTILDQGDELNRETYALAEELVVKAEALDITEASAWVTHARVSTALFGYGFDRSSARREAERAQAARALQLAPGSLDAQLAEFDVLITFAQDIPNAILRLQELARQHPSDWRIPELIGQCYRVAGELEKSLVANERALQLSPDRPLLKGNRINLLIVGGQWAEAEAAIRTMLQGLSSARLLGHGVYLQLMWSGELGGAAAAVQSWPAWFLLEDRGTGHAALTALWNRDPESALQVVRRFPRDYLRDYLFTGPSAVLSAWAHEQAGNTESARADWRTVQRVAERELRAAPDDQLALHWKGWALARLGDTEAAVGILQQLLQNDRAGPELDAVGQVVGRWGGLALAVGRTDIALAQLELKGRPGARAITRTNLRLNPVFDPLHDNPRFQAMVATAIGPGKKKETVTAALAADDKSVAVLAFANLSDDKANEYFSDGISEELLNVLAKIPGLKVTARTSSFHFKGKDTPIPEIAQKLGVAYVVEGSVRKSGDKVRITAQLIKAADGFHVWSDTFTRDLKDIFAVQDEIAALIAQNLKLSMGLVAPAVRRAVNPEAHQLVLEGRHFWNLRTSEGFDRAEVAFTKAIALDPQFAPAYAGLADVRWVRTVYASYSGVNFVLAADSGAASERALALDPTLAEAYPAAGAKLHWTGRIGEAGQQFKKAIALNPNYALAHHWYSLVLEGQGRLDEAMAEIEQAIQLDPLSVAALSTRHRFLLMAGRIPEALAVDEKMQALRPGFFLYIGMRTQALLAAGRRDEALAAARSIVAWQDREVRYVSDALAVYVLRTLGHEAEAVAHVENLLPRLPVDSYLRGVALAALDRWDEAKPYLERTPPGMCEIFFWNPMWDRWRDDPRFLGLLEKLGCMTEYKVARATLARMLKEQAAKK